MRKRLYAICLFKRLPNGRRSFYRIQRHAFPKAMAIRANQNTMLFCSMHGIDFELRPVREAHSATAAGILLLADISVME